MRVCGKVLAWPGDKGAGLIGAALMGQDDRLRRSCRKLHIPAGLDRRALRPSGQGAKRGRDRLDGLLDRDIADHNDFSRSVRQARREYLFEFIGLGCTDLVLGRKRPAPVAGMQ